MSKVHPRKLRVEPIIEAIAELRFRLPNNSGISVGPIYSGLGKEFPDMQQLPASRIPAEARFSNEELASSPLYRFSAPNSSVLLGDRSVAFAMQSYTGWNSFKASAISVFQHVVQVARPQIERVSVRYANFLRDDGKSVLMDKTTLSIKFGDLEAEQKVIHMRTELGYKDSLVVVQVISNAETTMIGAASPQSGLVLDIDSIVTGEFSWEDVSAALDKAHSAEKDVFFSLISKKTLREFGPVYDDGNDNDSN